MKLSDQTIEILKNYSSINSNIKIKKDSNKLYTVAPAKNVLSRASVAETFPQEVNLYDLGEFLNVMGSLHSDPELEFSDTFVTIVSKESSTKINYCSPDVVKYKEIDKVPSSETVINISAAVMNQIIKASSALKTTDVIFTGKKGKKNSIKMCNRKVDESHFHKIDLEGTSDNNYEIYMNVETSKFLPGDYSVKLNSKGASYFKNNSVPVEYWIAVEVGSKFEAQYHFKCSIQMSFSGETLY